MSKALDTEKNEELSKKELGKKEIEKSLQGSLSSVKKEELSTMAGLC